MEILDETSDSTNVSPYFIENPENATKWQYRAEKHVLASIAENKERWTRVRFELDLNEPKVRQLAKNPI